MIGSINKAIELINKGLSESSKKPFVVAIDGRCASGKTTFAASLGATVIHTDDFFRPRSKDGKLSISEYSGNFDMERFKKEVVSNLRSNRSFEYGIFDCKTQKIEKYVKIENPDFIVIEGTYSAHDDLGDYADLIIFFDVSAEEQKRRIIERNGAENAKNFENIWIPAEERYFERYQIIKKSNLTVNTEV